MKNAKFLSVLALILAVTLFVIGCTPGNSLPNTTGGDETTKTPETTGETEAPNDGGYEDLKYGDKRLSLKNVSVHDPSIVYDHTTGRYYIFGSHRAWAFSNDLASWTTMSISSLENNLSTLFADNIAWSARGGAQGSNTGKYQVDGNMWAPDVIYNEDLGKWCMYMSINGDNYYSSIVMLTADKINGNYEYQGTIVYSGFTNKQELADTNFEEVTGHTNIGPYVSGGRWNTSYGPNAIDPCVFYDEDGELWMSYGSWFGGIFLLKLDNKTGMRDLSYTYKNVANRSDEYLGFRISGGYGGTGEGSYIVWDKDTGYYYLYVSYCGLNATDNFSGYHLRLFRSKKVNGPYTDAMGHQAVLTSQGASQEQVGVKLFGNYSFSKLSGSASKGYMSGGHNSAFIDTDGQHYLVYHTRFNTGNEGHEVRVHQQFMNEDGWPVTAVYAHQGSVISKDGYSTEDIVGEYEFIDHGVDWITKKVGMLKTQKVTLNEDGTITGDVKGTWEQRTGKDGNGYYVTIKIGDVTFKGVFFKQYNESSNHNEVMTFTLIGNNDHSIWGSKIA